MLFRKFSNIRVYIRVYGKMPDQHFNISFITNPGNKVLKDEKLWDKNVPYFQLELGPCPLDWRTTIFWNVGPAFYHWPWYIWLCWKNAKTTFLVKILQSQVLRVKHIHSCILPHNTLHRLVQTTTTDYKYRTEAVIINFDWMLTTLILLNRKP